ncbi:MAG: fimbrial protein [Stenotrophomonas geniculata]
MGRAVVHPNVRAGEVIAEKSISYNASALGEVDCSSQGGSGAWRYDSSFTASATHAARETNIEGIGLIILEEGIEQNNLRCRGNNCLPRGTIVFQLVKTDARTGNGDIKHAGRVVHRFVCDGSGPKTPAVVVSLGAISVASPTCQLLAGSHNIVVDFGSVPNSTFSGPGSRGEDRDFYIRMSCQTGATSRHRSVVSIRIDAEQENSNMLGVLKLGSASGAAKGIGIQLMRRDGGSEREVRFGQLIGIGQTSAGSSLMTLPLHARYVQTLPGEVGVGIAGGQATFTIEYN